MKTEGVLGGGKEWRRGDGLKDEKGGKGQERS